MMIAKIRNRLKQNKGALFMFKYKGSRNQSEEFVGKILNTYNYVFTIKVNDYTNRIKSFSYNDILTNNLEMKEITIKK